MALPGHSPPPPFTGPGSPTRLLNGHLDNQLPPMYAQSARPMLPPSPHNYRFPNPPPIPAPSQSLSTMNDSRIPPPYKRPGSSMSISSLLGGDPEKPAQEMYPGHNSRGSSRQGSMSAPAPNSFSTMSPPQQTSKPGLGEYSYKPRSQTPDRIYSSYNTSGLRQRSSSSGTTLQRPAPFTEMHVRSASTIPAPAPRYLDQSPPFRFNSGNTNRNEQEERARRTSLSGILQRPSSQPQTSQNINPEPVPFQVTTSNSENANRQPLHDPTPIDHFQRNGVGTTYDIKPPGSHNMARSNGNRISPIRGPSLPASPEMRRSSANGTQGRALASILNGTPSQGPEPINAATHRMSRQDSTQSQGDRSIHGERGKIRQFSPFASALNSQTQHNYGQPLEEQSRKGSDELSQHRILLGLAAESKRGRYSPMPQVMQGAQAQTPVPDAGVKTEHGRVFSGLGGGLSTTPTSSQLKRDDGRPQLSEDNLLKMSRSASGFTKRSRKFHEEDSIADPETAVGGKPTNGRANKKGKHQHSYKTDLEELANQSAQRRGTPQTGSVTARNASTPANIGSVGPNSTYHTQNQRAFDSAPTFKSRKTIKVSSIFNNISRLPRRHLGNFTYRPEIAQTDHRKPNSQKFDVSIRPNLLPSFSAAEHLNCSYTIHVPKMWLQDRERGLICAEQYLWGSGIYTDDSDPIAAAVHAGFLEAGFCDAVDTALLSRIIHEQNPKIEWPKELNIPKQPMKVVQGKDLDITMVVLPSLERYEGSARFGIKSRAWPEGTENTQHDGVSFGILKIEFKNVGTEEMRMGRTGASRRERLRYDLEARQRGLQIQKERMAKVKQKRLDQIRLRTTASNTTSKRAPTSVPSAMMNGTAASIAQPVIASVA